MYSPTRKGAAPTHKGACTLSQCFSLRKKKSPLSPFPRARALALGAHGFSLRKKIKKSAFTFPPAHPPVRALALGAQCFSLRKKIKKSAFTIPTSKGACTLSQCFSLRKKSKTPLCAPARAESPEAHSQGQHPGLDVTPTHAPCKGKSINAPAWAQHGFSLRKIIKNSALRPARAKA